MNRKYKYIKLQIKIKIKINCNEMFCTRQSRVVAPAKPAHKHWGSNYYLWDQGAASNEMQKKIHIKLHKYMYITNIYIQVNIQVHHHQPPFHWLQELFVYFLIFSTLFSLEIFSLCVVLPFKSHQHHAHCLCVYLCI